MASDQFPVTWSILNLSVCRHCRALLYSKMFGHNIKTNNGKLKKLIYFGLNSCFTGCENKASRNQGVFGMTNGGTILDHMPSSKNYFVDLFLHIIHSKQGQ